MRAPFRVAVAIPIVLLAGSAVYQTLRYAYAESLARRDTVEDLTAAARVLPGNAQYYARIATMDPTAQRALATALRLNSTDTSWWIMQAVRQEEDGDLAGAERSLLKANAVCQYYTPRWSLAAFYYRQRNQAEFVKWARLALSSGYGAPEPLFVMAERLEVPPERMLRDVVPQDVRSTDAYRRFALGRGDLDSALTAALRLSKTGTPADRDAVLSTGDALFAKGRIEDAIDLWNRTVQAGWISLSPLDPAAGKSLAASRFADRLEPGFDWKYTLPDGVAASRAERAGALCLDFSGRQPERCDLLSQFVPLLPGRKYRLTLRQRSQSIARGSGLAWSLSPVMGGQAVSTALVDAAEDWSAQVFEFEAPAQKMPLKLLLSYGRAPGTTRIEGKLWIESAELALLP